jgi:hypothetical protein
LGFPSEGNFCHHARPVAPIAIEHQDQFCLQNGHTACPIYQRTQLAPLPAAITAPSYLRAGNRRVAAALAVLLVIISLAALVMLSPRLPVRLNTQRASIPGTGGDEEMLQPGPIGFLLLEPTMTPFQPETPTGVHLLLIDDCPIPEGWMTYIVNPTDSLIRLSVVYSIPVEMLQQVNCLSESTNIVPGQVLYLPYIPTRTSIPSLTATFPMVGLSITRVPHTSPPTITPLPSFTPLPTLTFTSAPPVSIPATQTVQPSATPEPTWTVETPPLPSSTPLPTATPMPTLTPTPFPTSTPVPTETIAPTITEMPTTTLAPTFTEAPTNTFEPTFTLVPTETEAPTATPEPTATLAPTATLTPTVTDLPTAAPEPTLPPVVTPPATVEPTGEPQPPQHEKMSN